MMRQASKYELKCNVNHAKTLPNNCLMRFKVSVTKTKENMQNIKSKQQKTINHV